MKSCCVTSKHYLKSHAVAVLLGDRMIFFLLNASASDNDASDTMAEVTNIKLYAFSVGNRPETP